MHLPEVESPPLFDQLMLDPEEVRAVIAAQLPASALFAASLPRERARARSCCARRAGIAHPALAAANAQRWLLQVAGQYPTSRSWPRRGAR